MHRRFCLNATSGSYLSDVYQFPFNNQQQLLATYLFKQTELCANAYLDETVC